MDYNNKRDTVNWALNVKQLKQSFSTRGPHLSAESHLGVPHRKRTTTTSTNRHKRIIEPQRNRRVQVRQRQRRRRPSPLGSAASGHGRIKRSVDVRDVETCGGHALRERARERMGNRARRRGHVCEGILSEMIIVFLGHLGRQEQRETLAGL